MTVNENSEYKFPKPQPAKGKLPAPNLTHLWLSAFYEPSLSMNDGKPSPDVQARVDVFIDDLVQNLRDTKDVKDLYLTVPKIDLYRNQSFVVEDSVPEWPESVRDLPSGVEAVWFSTGEEAEAGFIPTAFQRGERVYMVVDVDNTLKDAGELMSDVVNEDGQKN